MNRHILSGWAAALLTVSALGGTRPGAPATDSLPPATGWRVAELNGAPGLYRDGQPVAPVLFWQWELLDEDVRAMAGAGGDAYCAAVDFLYRRYGRNLLGTHVSEGPWSEHFAWDALTQIGSTPLEKAGFSDASASTGRRASTSTQTRMSSFPRTPPG